MESNHQIVKDHFSYAAEFYGNLYNGQTPLAHLFATRLEIVQELLDSSIDNTEDNSVLDVGCGPGMIAGYLGEHKYEYFGLDLSMEMLLDHKNRFGRRRSNHLVLGNMEKLPYEDSSFDAVLCLGALEYLEDATLAIQEQARVLKKDGHIIISMQNKWSPYRIWDHYIYHGRVFNLLRKLVGSNDIEGRLENIYSQTSLLHLLEDCRLQVQNIVYYDFNIWLPPLDRFFPKLSVSTSRIIEPLHNSPLKTLGSGFILEAVKVY